MGKIHLKVKTVIFDMDGVITNTMPDHFRAWKAVLVPFGIHVGHYDIYSREGQRGIHSVRELFAENKKSYTLRLAKELLRKKEEFFKRIVRRRFISGARSFLRYLHRNGYQLALVTGTSRQELHRILPDYLYNLFDVIITGNDVRKGKPDPEPYLLAIRKLKVKPQQVIVVENAPFGILAAKAAGLKCLAIATSLPKKYLRKADYIFPNFEDFRQKVKLTFNGSSEGK